MPWRVNMKPLATTALFLLSTTTTTPVTAQVPSPAAFIRRNNHGSVAAGSYVYIDGGLYSKYNDDDSVWGPFANTKTLAIDMRHSWTNSTVNITEISKGNSPIFFQPQFWSDHPANNTFYSWSGSAPSGYAVSEKSLWKFSGDGDGDGSWSRVSVDESFENLTRPVGGYSAVADGVGYFVGGYATESTDDVGFENGDAVPVPGVVSYNFSSGAWANRSSVGWTRYGTGMRGQAATVPFGGSHNGLLVLLGGESGTRETLSNERGYIDFSSVAIYDTANGSWYAQTTTGDAPSPRDEFCMAAAQGKNSTELLVFGGWTVSTGVTHSDSYILSLPAFRWFKGPTNTSPRVGSSCHTVGSGGQVLVIGGQDNNNNTYRWQNPDPWTQGLGIFDMTAMEWSDRYDADAAAYESPQVVKDWYNDGSNAEPDWSSDTVKALFSRTATEDPTTSGDGTASGTSSAGGGSAGSLDDARSSKPNAGAIAGGVVGGVVGAALVGFVFFCYRRRMQRKGPPKAVNVMDELDSESKAELHEHSMRVELPTKPYDRVELPTKFCDRAELPGHWPARAELPAELDRTHGKPVELPTSRDSVRE